tara:strand:- start:195 stop:578 length:384 start_codon:yes stop_codon:yes gene_type:complete
MGGKKMNLIFNLDGVICNEEDPILMKHCKPLVNVTEFMQWLVAEGHHITIWCERENTLEMKMMTESWLMINQIPYNRLLFDRPKDPVYVSDTPPNAKYLRGWGDNEIVAAMFEEWKVWITKKDRLEK